jgi:hypothetical protein
VEKFPPVWVENRCFLMVYGNGGKSKKGAEKAVLIYELNQLHGF